jgi:hypothetical protein
MSTTERRQLIATMQFHLRVARAYRAVGKEADAQSAERAASLCQARLQVDRLPTR